MREINQFLGGEIAQTLTEICKQSKTAAAWTAKDFQTEAAQKTSVIFIITESKNNAKTLLGFCAVRFAFEKAEITNFAILPQVQRMHFGTEIFAYTLNFLKEKGVKEVTLEVSSKNIPAQEFYKKFKFTNVSVRKKFYNMREDAQILKLNL
ncbi:MAG: ribosomal protein S18-alanine N-acetyltransferase [Elusimicrobiaceae bacterium]|nr:ribosomal protein S18-alanine N-acetyltransferase [Elusimicrobiaceae bacterium]